MPSALAAAKEPSEGAFLPFESALVQPLQATGGDAERANRDLRSEETTGLHIRSLPLATFFLISGSHFWHMLHCHPRQFPPPPFDFTCVFPS